MTLLERIEAMAALGKKLGEKDEYLGALMHRTSYHNGWFTIENQQKSVKAISEHYLDKDKLQQWLKPYNFPGETLARKVGIIMAGNIPLVGFHDLLSVFLSGHHAVIKLSDKDPYLLPYLIKLLKEIDDRTEAYFHLRNTIKEVDAVIATGSNNSARYFEQYFSKMPNIIRKNRNAVAVLSGEESKEALLALGNDIFQYFGLGCRNVAKIYVPEHYNFDAFLELLHNGFKTIVQHNKYKNNFDFNFAIHVLNKNEYKSNGCLILTKNEALSSRVGELYYETYKTINQVEVELMKRMDEIQCIVAEEGRLSLPSVEMGKAQQPELWDYADGVDTLRFLLEELN